MATKAVSIAAAAAAVAAAAASHTRLRPRRVMIVTGASRTAALATTPTTVLPGTFVVSCAFLNCATLLLLLLLLCLTFYEPAHLAKHELSGLVLLESGGIVVVAPQTAWQNLILWYF